MKHLQLSVIISLFSIFAVPVSGWAQLYKIQTDKLEFKRKEFNRGFNYSSKNERESWISDKEKYNEEMSANSVNLFMENRLWDFNEDRQQQFTLAVKAGPLWGKGTWSDSCYIEEIDAEHKLAGLRAAISTEYSFRYYYNSRNYTLLKINAVAQYDWYSQTSEGTVTDSNLVVTDYREDSEGDKFKAGIDARAGWGLGRLAVVNHFMTAEFLLKKYYPERDFSQDEILLLAGEIAKIKNIRDPKISHQAEIELKQLEDFLNQKMILISKRINVSDWESGEFLPRLHGSRVEFGPFFQYYNREPDFVYGGYLTYENEKYCNLKWNRKFSAAATYNSYKHNDWLLGQVSLAFSYFMQLQSRWDLGLTYIPALEIGNDKASLYHGLTPYLSWYSQLSSKNRIDMNFGWRITSDNKLMMPGPEISVSLYRSSY